MALSAGVIKVTVEYAKGLKDTDLFSKIDPYAVLKVGNQKFRTRTLQGAGTSPVWNETFTFNVINENMLEITLFDEDVTRDDVLGSASIPLAKARIHKEDRLQAPVIRPKSLRQKGFVSIHLKFEPNDALLTPPTQQTPNAQQASYTPYQTPQYSQYPPAYPQYPPPSTPSGYPGYPPAAPVYRYPPTAGYTSAPAVYPSYSPYPPAMPHYQAAPPAPYGGYSTPCGYHH